MYVQYLIRNGTIVDGTGAPAYRADVRVRHGMIAEIGRDLAAQGRERLIDASDCYVTPGFIESHNHWDAAVWWSPMLEPNSAYGTTTTVNGNCGFSVAPMAADPIIRKEMMGILNYFEDIPMRAQELMIPWDSWRTWSEYTTALKDKVKLPLNFAAFTGHIALRLTVMGLQAWERAAKPAEIAEMCALLDDALASGALGLSTNFLDLDRRGRPVPSRLADDAELEALFRVVGRYPDALVQVIVDEVTRHGTAGEDTARFGRLIRKAGARLLVLGGNGRSVIAVRDGLAADGFEAWTGAGHVAPTIVFNIDNSIIFGQHADTSVWQDLVSLSDEDEKLRLLADPQWRAAARASWEKIYSNSTFRDSTALTFLDSESGVGPVGVTLADYMAQTGFTHPSDALAEWFLQNGVRSSVDKRPNDGIIPEKAVVKIRDARAVSNISDGGAHGQILCGSGDNVSLLTDYVRDRSLLTIEEAVHVLTGRVAECFRLRDRGCLKVGMPADLTIFNLGEIDRRPMEKVWDVPDGEGGRTYRYSRAPAPMRLTLCNGVATFDNGVVTGRFPGKVIGPGSTAPQAIAAE